MILNSTFECLSFQSVLCVTVLYAHATSPLVLTLRAEGLLQVTACQEWERSGPGVLST